jgi:hypothetical protein
MRKHSWAEWLDYIHATGGVLTTPGNPTQYPVDEDTQGFDVEDFGDDAIVVDRASGSECHGPFHLAEATNPRTKYNLRFESRRGLLGHLWNQVIETLESEEAIRGSARHAVRSGDYSYIVRDVSRKRIGDNPWHLQEIRDAYQRRARKSLRRAQRLDLNRASILHRATTMDGLADRERRWNHWIAFARAELSEDGLSDTVSATAVPRAGRTRL